VNQLDGRTLQSDVDLTGRVALITGAAGALGTRFAHTLADHGASVAVADVRTDQLKSVQEELTGRTGARSGATFLDLTVTNSFADVVTQIEAELGPVDVLINNAGINDANRPQRLTLETISRVIATNLEGPFALTCEVAKRLIERVGDPSAAFPRKRIGRPDQLDSTLLYLVSPASDCVTGTVIKIDDGQKPR
jgi:NAD(P)-dependent dehydrogenase (short-subunit alcohol dehydrogenase family)